MTKSQYCTDQEHEQITEILKEWVAGHPEPDKEWQFGFSGSDELLTARRVYEHVKDLTPGGEWFLKEFRRLADEHKVDIVELVRNGFKDGGQGRACPI